MKETEIFEETYIKVDLHVGQRLRQQRLECGYSQKALATLLGITFQQVQKYENGTNRLSASRLFAAASILEVPVSFFFEGAPPIPYNHKK